MRTLIALLIVLAGLNAHAATYYVKNGGNNSAAGTSDATAWATIAKVNSSVSGSGDDVYFRAGDTFTFADGSGLVVDWAGTALNYATVGAYYMDGPTETVGLGGNAKPILQGDFNQSLTPTSIRGVLLSGDYQRIENIQVEDTIGHGIYADAADYVQIAYCRVKDVGYSGIILTDLTGGVAHYNKVTRDNLAYGLGLANYWGAGIRAIRGTSVTLEYNEVGPGGGEGVGIARGSYSCIVQYNLVYDRWSNHLYLAACEDGILRHNIAFGSPTGEFHRYTAGGREWADGGILINLEHDADHGGVPDPGNHKIYGNIVVGLINGFGSSNGSSTTGRNPDGQVARRCWVYNNTFIDNYRTIVQGTRWIPFDFANNLIEVTPSATFTSICDDQPRAGTWGDVRVFGNFWRTLSTLPSGWQHSSDVVGDPRLTGSGWQALAAPNGFDTSDDFKLQDDSPAISSALDAVDLHYANAAETDNNLLNGFGSGTEMNVADAADASTPLVVTLVSHEASGTWDFGAWVYEGTPTTPTLALIEALPAPGAAYASGTTSVVETVRVTDGSCRSAFGSNDAWASMSAMSCSGSAPDITCTVTHDGLTDASYTDYYRCQDAAGNELGGSWSWRVGAAAATVRTHTAPGSAVWH